MKIALITSIKRYRRTTGPDIEKKLMDHNDANLQTTKLGTLQAIKVNRS